MHQLFLIYFLYNPWKIEKNQCLINKNSCCYITFQRFIFNTKIANGYMNLILGLTRLFHQSWEKITFFILFKSWLIDILCCFHVLSRYLIYQFQITLNFSILFSLFILIINYFNFSIIYFFINKPWIRVWFT